MVKRLHLQQQRQGAPASTDITGIWDGMRSGYDFASFSKGDPPMTAWGKAQFDAAKPSQAARRFR